MSLASESMYALRLQRRRLRTIEPEDQRWVFGWWADLQFFIVMVQRLRRVAALVRRLPAHAQPMQLALREFRTAVPGVDRMRNIGEHVDDYALDSPKRHDKSVDRKALQVGAWDGTTFTWLGSSLNVDDAIEAAERVYEAIQQERDKAARAAGQLDRSG